MTTQCNINFFQKVTNVRQNSLPGETYPYEAASGIKTVWNSNEQQPGSRRYREKCMVKCGAMSSYLPSYGGSFILWRVALIVADHSHRIISHSMQRILAGLVQCYH